MRINGYSTERRDGNKACLALSMAVWNAALFFGAHPAADLRAWGVGHVAPSPLWVVRTRGSRGTVQGAARAAENDHGPGSRIRAAASTQNGRSGRVSHARRAPLLTVPHPID